MEPRTLAESPVAGKARAVADVLRAKNIRTFVLSDRSQALEKLRSLIPEDARVMNGSSKTLEEIGFIAHLRSDVHGWNNLHEAILNEKDPRRRHYLRKRAVFADYFVAGANAITESGEIIIASATGSQLPSVAFSSDNVIFVAGTNKIVADIDEGIRRLRECVLPIEDRRMKENGYAGTTLSKILLVENEPVDSGRTVVLILVEEFLGV